MWKGFVSYAGGVQLWTGSGSDVVAILVYLMDLFSVRTGEVFPSQVYCCGCDGGLWWVRIYQPLHKKCFEFFL